MIRINLLKPETKDIREVQDEGVPEFKARKTPRTGNMIILLLIVGLAAVFITQKKAIDREQRLLNQAKEEKSKLQYVIAKLDELQKQKSSLERKIGLINELKSQQEMAVRIMDELSKSIPNLIWLNEVGYNAKTLQIKGNALSNNLIADFIANLENSPYFDGVNLISSTQKTAKNDQYMEFSLSSNVVNPNQPPPPPPPPKEVKKRRAP